MKSDQNWRFYYVFSMVLFSLRKNFLLSEKMVTKIWRHCEKNSDVIWYCESQCDRNSSHIVTHIVRRMWENCEWRWIPLLSSYSHLEPTYLFSILEDKLNSSDCWMERVSVFLGGKTRLTTSYLHLHSYISMPSM